jgi:hypothetical protein
MTARLSDDAHGRAASYARGCRCDACRSYNIEKNRTWRERVMARGCTDREWDDGIVDDVVVDRLCADPEAWRNGLPATPGERKAAATRLGASSWRALGINGREFRVAS